MWEDFWVELAKLFPQLAVTFLGVFLAFSLDRAIDWGKRKQDRRDLLHDLREELEESKKKLTSQGILLYPDIWESAISSGQIRLLNSEQVTKLARVYRFIKGTDYEATRVRDVGEDYEGKRLREDSIALSERWRELSTILKQREAKLRNMIEEILKEKWWT